MIRTKCSSLINMYKVVNGSRGFVTQFKIKPTITTLGKTFCTDSNKRTESRLASGLMSDPQKQKHIRKPIMPVNVTYEDVALATKSTTTCIIDVREPAELQKTGEIPNSINIPLSELENILNNLSNDDFQTKYKRQKPTTDTPIIFTCQSGKRAGVANDKAKKLGFAKTQVYEGSWLDWEKHLKG